MCKLCHIYPLPLNTLLQIGFTMHVIDSAMQNPKIFFFRVPSVILTIIVFKVW